MVSAPRDTKMVPTMVAADITEEALQHQSKGQYSEAEELFLAAHTHCAQTHGQQSIESGICLQNLSRLYRRMGRFKEAIPLCERAIAIMEGALGPQPLHKHQKLEERVSLQAQIASALSSLAHLYKSHDRLEEAEKLLLRALDITESALGGKHNQMGTCLNNIAMLYLSQRRLDDAEPRFAQALEIMELTFGHAAPQTAPILDNWGKLLEMRAEKRDDSPEISAETVEYMEAQAKIMRNCAKGIRDGKFDAAQEAQELSNVGFQCQGHANYAAAEVMLKRALYLIEKAYGKDDYRVAVAANNLAVAYQSMSPPSCTTPHPKLTEAESLLRRALDITQRVYGAAHLEVAQRLNNLAMLLRSQGKLSDAEPLLEQAVVITETAMETQGAVDGKFGTRLDNLARLYLDEGKLGQAEPTFKRAIAALEKELGPSSQELAFCYQNMSMLYKAQELPDKAQVYLLKAIEMRKAHGA